MKNKAKRLYWDAETERLIKKIKRPSESDSSLVRRLIYEEAVRMGK